MRTKPPILNEPPTPGLARLVRFGSHDQGTGRLGLATYQKAYRAKHKADYTAYQKAYRQAHKAESKAYRKAHKAERVESRKEYRRSHKAEDVAYAKAYHQAHKAECAARANAWRQAHKAKCAACVTAWYQAHPHKRADYDSCRRARKHGTAVEKVSRAAVYERDSGRCHLCGKKVPKKGWHLDHLIPLARGGEHSYINVAVACPACNIAKGTKDGAQLRLY